MLELLKNDVMFCRCLFVRLVSDKLNNPPSMQVLGIVGHIVGLASNSYCVAAFPESLPGFRVQEVGFRILGLGCSM